MTKLHYYRIIGLFVLVSLLLLPVSAQAKENAVWYTHFATMLRVFF